MIQSAHLVAPGRRGIDEFRLRPKVHATKLHVVQLLWHRFTQQLDVICAAAPGLPSWYFICALMRGTGAKISDSTIAFKTRTA